MLIQMQPRQAAVGPDVAFGRGPLRVIEGGDGHVDAARAQVSLQCQLRPTVAAKIARAGWRRVVPRRFSREPLKGCRRHSDPGGHDPAADPPANRAMAMGDIV